MFSECLVYINSTENPPQRDLFLAQGQTWTKTNEIQNFSNTCLHVHFVREQFSSYIWCPVSQPVLLIFSVFLFHFRAFSPTDFQDSDFNSSGKHFAPNTVNQYSVWLYRSIKQLEIASFSFSLCALMCDLHIQIHFLCHVPISEIHLRLLGAMLLFLLPG